MSDELKDEGSHEICNFELKFSRNFKVYYCNRFL